MQQYRPEQKQAMEGIPGSNGSRRVRTEAFIEIESEERVFCKSWKRPAKSKGKVL